jgi:hypothetical protein
MTAPRHPLIRLAAFGVVAFLVGCAGSVDVPGASTFAPGPAVETPLSGDVGWPAAEDETFQLDVERAAGDVVGSYLALTDRITSEGGDGAWSMSALTTSTWFPTEQRGFDHYVAEGLRTIGETRFHSLVVQSVWQPGGDALEIDVVACVDATGVWLLPLDAPDPPEGLVEWVASDAQFFEGDDLQFQEWTSYLDTYLPAPGVVEAVVFWLVGSSLTDLRIDGTANWEGVHSCRDNIAE